MFQVLHSMVSLGFNSAINSSVLIDLKLDWLEIVSLPSTQVYSSCLNTWTPKGERSSVQSLSRVRCFGTPWTAAHQASLSITNCQSPLCQWCHPTNLILCHLLLLLPSIFPSIRVFSNESALRIRWPKDWSSSFIISPSSEHPGLISFRMDWLDLLQSKGLSRVFSNTTVQKHQFFSAQPSSQSNSHIHTWPQEKP